VSRKKVSRSTVHPDDLFSVKNGENSKAIDQNGKMDRSTNIQAPHQAAYFL